MMVRRGFGVALTGAFTAALVFTACSDDESSSGATAAVDGGPDGIRPPPPPPPDPQKDPPPPDGVDRTGLLGNASVVADVGEPTDGPSWHVPEGALYFTVPGSATPLRRLVPGGAVTPAAYDDAGASPPVGTANGGGSRIVITEREVLAAVDTDDAGVATVTRRAGPANVVLGDIAAIDNLAGPTAYFVDTTSARAFRWDPTIPAPNDLTLVIEVADAGRATGIATRLVAGTTRIYVAGGGISQLGNAVVVYDALGLSEPVPSDQFQLVAPPNGIAVDESGFVYVAWAKGIDVYREGSLVGPSPGLPLSSPATSLAFGGADRRTLYVTTSTGKIYAVPATQVGVLR